VSPLRAIGLVAAREVREQIRSRVFQIILALMLAAVAGLIVIPAKLIGPAGGSKPANVGLVGDVPAGLEDALDRTAQQANLPLRLLRFDRPERAEQAIRDGDVQAVIEEGGVLVVRDEPGAELRAVVAAAVRATRFVEKLETLGLDQGQMAALLAPLPELRVRALEAKGKPDSPGEEAVRFIGVIVMFMAIIIFASMVIGGVVSEKSSRVVEVLLATLRPWHLLTGKIAGIGLLGLGQLALVLAVAMAAARTSGAIELPATTASGVAWALVWFILGYGFYAALFGATGALVSSQEDAQSASIPITLVATGAYIFSIYLVQDASGNALMRAIALLPPVAPFAIPALAGVGDLKVWEIAVAITLMFAGMYFVLRLAGRLYAGSILKMGARVNFRDAWRGGDM